MLYENNLVNLTLFVDFTDFELHQKQFINVESIATKDNVQGFDNFINDNEIQYDDTLEDDIDDEEDV